MQSKEEMTILPINWSEGDKINRFYHDSIERLWTFKRTHPSILRDTTIGVNLNLNSNFPTIPHMNEIYGKDMQQHADKERVH